MLVLPRPGGKAVDPCACARCAFWRGGPPDAGQGLWEELARAARRRSFRKGQLLFSAEDCCDKIFILRAGAVKLFHQDPGGKELIVSIASPGDVLSLPRRRGEKFGISAAALADGEYCAFSREELRFLLVRFPGLGLFLLDQAQELLARSYAALEKIGLLRAEERLAATLLELARLAGGCPREGIVIEIPVNLNILAGLSGVVPETAARVLARWKRDGVVSLKRRRLVLKDPAFISGVLARKN